MELSAVVRVLWAKSGTGDDWHPVIAHLLDVAASAAAILEREPASTRRAYAADLRLDEAAAPAWIVALVGLHDLGKASPAFQQKWSDGCQRVRALGLTWHPDSKPTAPPDDVPHNVISQVVLPRLLQGAGWQRRAAVRAADAVGAHHGHRAVLNDLRRAAAPNECGDTTWDAARRELFDAVLAAVGAGAAPPVRAIDGPTFERLAGLTSFADWIGSALPRALLDPDLPAYYTGALGRARSMLDSIGWADRAPLLPADRPAPLAEVFRYLDRPDRPFIPRALQLQVEALLDDATGPTLLLVEAPMGEGKTEAALYAHLRLQAANGHRGLYVALPTQATGNAMFTRLGTFLGQVRGGEARPPLDLQLLHGASLLNDDFQRLIVRPNVAPGDEATQADMADHSPDAPAEGVRAGAWFTHRRRALLSEYGVGTVDQALMGVLPTKHQFVRLWGLANRVVVLDEVHAYDTYTSALIEDLVRWLRALGSSVILMTATLPAARRRALLAAWGAPPGGEADYPRITRVVDGSATSHPFQGERVSSLAVRSAPTAIPDLAALLRDLVGRGGRVACIVNTVQRAQDLYIALEGESGGATVMLFHARYPTDERQRREQATLETFGERRGDVLSGGPPRLLLIATQVVEQSLDLDFDVLVTDLAPIDLLLQRAGRLHRHLRAASERHGHPTPVLYVAGLNTADSPEAVLGAVDASQIIYEPYVLLRTWLALRGVDRIALPGDIDPLVQTVYSDTEPTDLAPGWTDALATHRHGLMMRHEAEATAALHGGFGRPDDEGWLDVPPPPRRDDEQDERDDPNADDDPAAPQTRLGRPTVTVIPLHAKGGRLYLDAAHTHEVRLGGMVERQQATDLYSRSVRLGRPDVVHRIAAHASAHRLNLNGWRRDSLLHRCWPLVLTNGRTVVGSTPIRLTPELGIVYGGDEIQES